MKSNINVNIDGNFIEKIISKINHLIKDNIYYVNIKNMSQVELSIINKFFNTTLNEYTLDSVTLVENNHTYPIILKLIKRKILKELNIHQKIDNYDGLGVKYQLTNKAWKKLNKTKYKGGFKSWET